MEEAFHIREKKAEIQSKLAKFFLSTAIGLPLTVQQIFSLSLVTNNKSLVPAQRIFHGFHPCSAEGIIGYMIIFLARNQKQGFPAPREYNQRNQGKAMLFFSETDKMQKNVLLF